MQIPNFYEEPRRTDGLEINPSLGSLPTTSSVFIVPENILLQGYEESLHAEARILSGGKVFAFNTKNNSLSCIGSQKTAAHKIRAGTSIENIRDSFNIHLGSLNTLIKQLEAYLDRSMPEQRAIIDCQKIRLGQYVLEYPNGQVSLRTLLRIRNNEGCSVTYHESYGFRYSFGNLALTEIIGELVPNPKFYVQTRYSYEAFTEELALLSSLGNSIELYFHTRPSLYCYIKSILSSRSKTSSDDISIASIIPICREDQLLGDKHLIEIAEGAKESKFISNDYKQTDRFIIDTNIGLFFYCFELNRVSGLVQGESRKIR